MRLLFFGTYDAGAHPRVAVLRDGLRARGATVRECNAPLGLSTAARVSMLRRPWTLPLLAWRLLACWSALAVALAALAPGRQLAGRGGRRLPRPLRRAAGPAAVPARAGRARPPGRRQRHRRRPRRVAAACGSGCCAGWTRRRWAAPTSWSSTPTSTATPCPAAHRGRALVVPVGAPESWYAGRRRSGDRRCRPADAGGVLRPLHAAAGRPGDRGRAGRARRRRAPGRGHDDRRRPGPRRDPVAGRRQPPGALAGLGRRRRPAPALVAEHDVCLGIFGTGPKALRVVPNKVFQGAAAGCAVVTSDTAPQRRAARRRRRARAARRPGRSRRRRCAPSPPTGRGWRRPGRLPPRSRTRRSPPPPSRHRCTSACSPSYPGGPDDRPIARPCSPR